MENKIKERVLAEANYMINTEKTIRNIAKMFNVSKSTVHKDLKDRLKIINLNQYKEVQKIIKKHYNI